MVEAATTSALGGVLGIALGYAVSMAANKVLPMFMTDTTVTVSPSFNSIVVAFGISVGIGEIISCTVLGVLLVKIIESSKALRKIFAA